MARAVSQHYADPLDEIWLATAKKLGIEIRRAAEAYASYDGHHTLTIAPASELDRDDSLAQIILHELCHALVAGPEALREPDWGLCNTDASDLLKEHACHRLQAALSDRHGLRALFAVTTEHRPYWDALPLDPLAPGDDPAIALAREAFVRARRGRWGAALEAALAATARIAHAAQPFAGEASLWANVQALHASGFPLARDPAHSCGSCAWLFIGGPGTKRARCRQTRRGAHSIACAVEPEALGCERWEARLDADACGACGACCREGFDLVPVRARDRIRARHPELVASDRHGLHLPRPGGRCVLLAGDGGAQPYRCRAYDDRPHACVEFEIAGDACLEARRRVGLSR